MASRPLKNESWFRRVDSSRLGRLERGRNLAQCSCEVSLGTAPGTSRVPSRCYG
ncbi:hypothetical protein BS47DRAFT_1350380 [Hydnum rufescens UP504]|uniref:Uncharacterized protein n=1 Tax=Hydnum rufescens UP504 TaxID=1448309 RepID=A0A9P6AP48_9AGAM|nr:hypothetical protein BS47DRAFT_1350380 [Hydnum rufescens UP504]